MLCLCSLALQAQQQVIATSGNVAQNNSGSISWTLGEPVIVTLTANNKVLNQGFQQGNSIKNDRLIGPAKGIKITLWPNPTHDKVVLTIDTPENRQYRVYNIHGELLQTQNIINKVTSIDLSSLTSGTYLLKVLQGKSEEQTFTIIKQ
jgi:hypothetical protein